MFGSSISLLCDFFFRMQNKYITLEVNFKHFTINRKAFSLLFLSTPGRNANVVRLI